jgi:hypothetical protein
MMMMMMMLLISMNFHKFMNTHNKGTREEALELSTMEQWDRMGQGKSNPWTNLLLWTGLCWCVCVCAVCLWPLRHSAADNWKPVPFVPRRRAGF